MLRYLVFPSIFLCFFFNDTATTEIYTLSLHDALPISLAKMYANRQSEVHKRLEESEKAAQRARDLTYQLLTFSKGGAPLKKTISLQDLVKESASFALRGSNIKCEFSFPGDLWPVDADEGQMSQALHNLIINAAPAMSDGGTL